MLNGARCIATKEGGEKKWQREEAVEGGLEAAEVLVVIQVGVQREDPVVGKDQREALGLVARGKG